jgi:cell division protein FtsL
MKTNIAIVSSIVLLVCLIISLIVLNNKIKEYGECKSEIANLNERIGKDAMEIDGYKNNINALNEQSGKNSREIGEYKNIISEQAGKYSKLADDQKKSIISLNEQIDRNAREMSGYKNNVNMINEFTGKYSSILKNENTLFKEACNLQIIATIKLEEGIYNTNNFKELISDLNLKANKLRKEGGEFAVALDNNGPSLKDGGFSITPIDANDLLKSLDKIKDFSGKAQDILMKARAVDFAIYAKDDWKGSNVNVENGDYIFMKVQGECTVNPMVGKVDSKTGYENNKGYEANRITDKAPYGAAIVRIHGGNAVLRASTEDGRKSIIADASGELEFTINDNGKNDNGNEASLINIIVISKKEIDDCFDSLAQIAKY